MVPPNDNRQTPVGEPAIPGRVDPVDAGLPLQAHVEAILQQMWVTKGARFEAQRRLTQKQNASLFTQSFLALYVIVAGLLPLLIRDIPRPELMNVVTIATSLFLLILNITEAGQNYSLRGERMLKCAQGIAAIHDKLRLQVASGKLTFAHCDTALDEYHRILNEYSENHDHVDLHSFRANVRNARHKPFGSRGAAERTRESLMDGVMSAIEVFKIRIWWKWHVYGMFVVVLIVPILLIGSAFVTWGDVIGYLARLRVGAIGASALPSAQGQATAIVTADRDAHI